MKSNTVQRVVDALVINSAHTATAYVAPDLTVRATRVLKSNGKIDRRGAIQVCLTIGKPNHAARKFVKACQKAGEPFPVRKVQLKFPPKR